MATTEEILRRIEKGGTLDELAAELDIRKSALVAMIEFMVRAGYLKEIGLGGGQGCGGCPMSGTCRVPVPGSGRGWVRLYMLTEKGMEYIKNKKYSREEQNYEPRQFL
ncbi:MAG: FeoC-like transcriptional regulator [Methanophagales archaeon]|nr:FeoC-like transcriptional regulator [Methanophagales archaeon]